MLNNERISEAEKNLRSFLAEGMIKKEGFKKIVFETYMRNHRESLLVARRLSDEKVSNLWVVVASYYSMFYIANAMLYKLGYKVGPKIAHKVTADALIVLVRNKLAARLLENYELARGEALQLSDNLLQSFEKERLKRSDFQYETTEEIKRGKAETSLNRAEEFSKELEKMI